MSRIGASLFLLALLIGLHGCGQKAEEAAAPGETEPAAPVITPGEMVLIPAGEFILGTNDKDSNAFPEQKVDLPAFWIDKYEVTNMEFQAFAAETGFMGEGDKEGKSWRTFVSFQTAKNPVVYVTYNDASAYCKHAGKRLPTELEWEKAARGAEGSKYPWGEKWEANKSNTYETGYHQPVAIGQFQDDISPFGVHDMLGNVREWTDSWYKAYKGNSIRDPNFGENWRVVRGASSSVYGARFALWIRAAYAPGSLYDFGFRCAKDAAPEESAQGAQPK
ncbi:MAG: formylglycine-generating enzyme family protein [Acidobacteria bacterium]|nr:formylglycine-generating enzyme family protein [Acidobacteriota bacterium]